MPTESIPAFMLNLTRARYFLEIHKNAQIGAGAPPLRYRELPRAAIVFAVGAIDAYLSEVTAEIMLRQLQVGPANNLAREVLKKVQQDIPTLAVEVAVLATNAERVQRIRDVIVDHFQNRVSNHGAKAVAAAMDRMGHAANEVWNHLLGLGHQQSAEYLEHWTTTRHRIVHQGQRPRVHRSQAERFVTFANDLVKRIDGIADDA